MLTLYTAERQHLPRLRSALPPEQAVVLVEDWDRVESEGPSTDCSVVHLPWLNGSPVLPRLSAFKGRHPHHPVVLVTGWDPENARCLKDVYVEEVVWFREVERELSGAVERTCAHDYNYLRCLAMPIEEAEHLPATLRRALAYACRNERPVCSVKQLAAAAGCDRRTLWHQWNRTFGAGSPLRLQDFLHWVLLLRAVGRKTPGESWADVAESVGVHAHTLWRFSKQLAGCTLPELAAGGHPVIVERFRDRVLDFLLKKEPLDIP